MFFLLVPVRSDRYECRADRAFAEAKQETDGCEACKIFRRRQTHTNAAPYNTDVILGQRGRFKRLRMDSHRESDEFRQSQSTHKIDEGVFRNQLTYVTLD